MVSVIIPTAATDIGEEADITNAVTTVVITTGSENITNAATSAATDATGNIIAVTINKCA